MISLSSGPRASELAEEAHAFLIVLVFVIIHGKDIRYSDIYDRKVLCLIYLVSEK